MPNNQVQARQPAHPQVLDLRIGELVEVRSQEEILATLDERGRLDALPFMPEMLQFCGRQFRVYKRAIKTCDSINNTGMYRMEHAVHLEGTRCDGQAHGGCQATCMLFWKEAWLKRVDPAAPAPTPPAAGNGLPAAGNGAPAAGNGTPRCSLDALMRATRAEPTAGEPAGADGQECHACQATEMPKAAPRHIAGWDLRQYVLDVTAGNARPLPMLRSLLIMVFNKYQKLSTRILPARLWINGGRSFRFVTGPLEGKTPREVLNLQPGELVEIKSRQEILATLDTTGHNRGLRFDVEELKYCGRRARVLRRVERIIDEKTGRMLRFGGDCVILENVICEGDYHQYCPRSIYPFWREIWLRRVS